MTTIARLAALLSLWIVCAVPARAADDLPIFDAHLHYNVEARGPFPLDKVLALFKANAITGILANSRPNDGTVALYAARSEELWVVPFIRLYATRDDIGTWFRDPKTLALIKTEMKRGFYRGIGEFHLHGKDAEGVQVKRIVDLSVEHDFWLHAHSDTAAVETLYRHNPKARVIWAHTGFSTPPAEVERLLAAYPTLMGELSYRGGIADSGNLSNDWRQLFTKHPGRFLLGSDTWINERWESYGRTMGGYREWLRQLPREAAEQIAHKNAERLFGRK
jgi:hypothetical protein